MTHLILNVTKNHKILSRLKSIIQHLLPNIPKVLCGSLKLTQGFAKKEIVLRFKGKDIKDSNAAITDRLKEVFITQMTIHQT